MNQLLKRYVKEIFVIFMLVIFMGVFTGVVINLQFNDSLTSVYMKKITALKNSLKINIEKYFQHKADTIQTISQNADIQNAFEEFSNAFNTVSIEYGTKVDNDSLKYTIQNHTERTFYNIPNSSAKRAVDEYIAKNINGNILQNLYVANNPFESSVKYMLFDSGAKLTYDKVHMKFHKIFVTNLKRYNFYDIFLIDNDGNVIYSVFKELDFGTNLKSGVYSDSSLAEVYRKALKNEGVSFGDFKVYEPSYNKPAAFFAIPVKKEDKTLGVIAFQISVKEINNIMTFEEKWEDVGLGKSGESYLVGDDYLMRSNSRFVLDMNDRFVNELATTVGVLNVRSKAVENALSKKEGQGIIHDYRNIEVLSSYDYINVMDKVWGLMVEVDKGEIDAEVKTAGMPILKTGVAIAIIFITIVVYIFVRFVIRPIYRFEKELEKKLEDRSNELKESTAILKDYKRAVDESSIVSKTDARGIIKYVNDAFCDISGFSRDELVGKSHNIIRHQDTPKSVFEDLWRTIQNKRVWKGIIKNRKKDGGDYVVKSTIVPILDSENNILEFMSIRTDITELVSKEKQLLEQTMDELTKLPNRVKLFEDIDANNSEYKLAIMQIDKFKEINDFYGYEDGDLILVGLTSILQRIITENSFKTYRIGSGEFAVLSFGGSMERLIKNMTNVAKYCDHNVISAGSDSFNISVSIGISSGDASKLFFNAEMALRKAMESSKFLEVFEGEGELEEAYKHNIMMTKKIKNAIKNDNILVYAQPIAANGSGGKTKYECLIRMYDDENKKVLSPFFFLDIAKKARLYPTLTKIVIEKSFEYFQDKRDEFSINLSIEDILSDDIVTFLKRMIDYYKIGHRVVLELVESEGIENFEDVHKFIKEFKGYGCQIAIDDFGTGYSNFEYLMKLDVDYIKIDGSLIKNVDTDDSSQLIVELIVQFAKKMNIKTIAEFIHNDSVHKKVLSMGIDYSQGYHLGEPKELNGLHQ